MDELVDVATSLEPTYIQIHSKLYEAQKLGFLSFAMLKYKPAKIKDFEVNRIRETVKIILETSYGELYPHNLAFSQVDIFLNQFSEISPRYKIVYELEKEIQHSFEGVEVGFSSDYDKFVIVKPLNVVSNTLWAHLRGSMSQYGNIVPVIVVKKNDKFYILDGRVRFKLCREEKKDIFYLNITPLLNVYKSDRVLFNLNNTLNLYHNGIKLKDIWSELCNQLQSYRELNVFIRKNKVQDYIDKIQFILLFDNSMLDLINGVGIFNDKEEKFDLVKETYQIFNHLVEKETSKLENSNVFVRFIQKYRKDFTIEQFIELFQNFLPDREINNLLLQEYLTDRLVEIVKENPDFLRE